MQQIQHREPTEIAVKVRSRRTKMSKHGKSIISGRSCADGVDGVVENGALLSRVE